MELDEIRKRLNRLDNEIVIVLAECLVLIPNIANCKIKHSLARYQSKMEKEILSKQIELGEKKWA